MSLLKVLKATRGAIAKQAVLKGANANDKKIFVAAYRQDVSYGLNFSSIDWETVGDNNLDGMFALLTRLSTRELSGNAASEAVNTFAKENGDLIKLICNKDLDCGISFGSLDKTFGKLFISKFAVQLAKEVPLKDLTYPLEAQIKYDGVRVVAIKHNDTVTFKTRNGKTFQCPGLEQQILGLGEGNFVFDGEIVSSGGLSSERTNVSGRVNSALHGGVLSTAHLTYVVFDFLSLEDFTAQKCDKQYVVRYKEMLHRLLQGPTPNIQHATTQTVFSAEEANNMYASLLAEGYEGLVLKKATHLYTFKRSKDWVKVKAVETVDLLCSDIQEGEGKYAGMIGALECYGIVQGKCVKVMVGSGLTDCHRSFPHDHFINKYIEVKYNQLIQDSKTGEWSLFLPRFVMVRHDKS